MDDEIAIKLSDLVERATGEAFIADAFESCHGGCIHVAGIYSDGQRSFFVKVNRAEAVGMFAAEARGLKALKEAQALRVPEVIGHAVVGDQSLLVLEALDLGWRAKPKSWADLGEGLAKLHMKTAQEHGFDADNYIGSSPQTNHHHTSWAEFFVEERLRPQFERAATRGMIFDGKQKFMRRVGEILASHQPSPSLLHGDLWSGNVSFTPDGVPVIFDPATYYGDRETDLAFTEFFGGFAPEFYAAYRKAWPLADGYEQRRELYNLYHVLNHANLFGGGYASQVQDLMRRLIA